MLLLFLTCRVFADTAVVIYPEATSPYQTVFESIIKGYKERFQGRVITQQVSSTFQHLDSDYPDADVMVALSKDPLNHALKNTDSIPIVAGLIDIFPDDARVSGVRLHVYPASFYALFEKFIPGKKKIFFVYREKYNDLAQAAVSLGERNDYRVTLVPVKTIKDAVQQIDSVTKRNTNTNDAIVYLSRGVVSLNADIIIPLIMKNSWDNKLPVVSELPSHTKRGLLFSLYPDYTELGRQLADLSLNVLSGADKTVLFNTANQLSVNLRTAQHLGLDTNAIIAEDIDVIFPSK